jgi:predicted AlkP superfamily phosphohydrolase/phosphomutase
MADTTDKISRRQFIKQSVAATAVLSGVLSPSTVLGSKKSIPSGIHRKVVILGIDGMDPVLCEQMMARGKLPNFDRLRKRGGYRRLGTSIPPQSPVAWSNFINGAGPGSHGIFDFIHRNPKKQCAPFFSVADTVRGEGFIEFTDYKIQLDFWPFNHKPPETILNRQGVPFWDYLDKAGIESVFYDLPSNYPASPSKYGHHRCLSGMGTPDLLGTYGTYQFFAEDLPQSFMNEGGGKRFKLNFENETAPATLIGPQNSFLATPVESRIKFHVHRDKRARAAVIEVCGKKILLKEGQWSNWQKLTYDLKTPAFMPDEKVSGICRFYLQSIDPVCRLYVTPINTDPSDPAIKLSEPENFITNISKDLGLFYTDILVLVMSDHGFGSFKRQFNLNRWLRENGYLNPPNATSLFSDVDWSKTSAYGLGINSLYLNLKGREIYGIVKPGQEQEDLMNELILKLQSVKDIDGKPVIRTVHRAAQAYRGKAMEFAPDLVIGYFRPYRASWSTCLGGMTEDILSDNHSAWAADHCADVMEVPGILFSNRPVNSIIPSLIDLAPTVLTSFGLKSPSSMEGKNIFKS